MRRVVVASVTLGAAAISALLGSGQLWAARAAGVLELAQDYTAGNDTWPFQQYLLAWYTGSTVALAAALAWPLAGSQARWGVRFGAVAGAVTGAATCFPLARAWSAGAEAVADPVGQAIRAVLVGLAVGAGGALLATASPAVRRALIGWTVWTWAAATAAVVVESNPPAFGLPPTPHPFNAAWQWLAVLSPVVVFAVLGAWAAWRGERLPVVGAIAGSLLLAAPSGVLAQFNGFSGDHYNPGTEFWLWLFLSLLGGCMAAGAAAIARARRRVSATEPMPAPAASAGRSVAATMLQVGGGLLVAATLLMTSTALKAAAPLVAASGALAFAVGLLADRGVRLGRLAGAAIAGTTFVAVSLLIGWVHGLPTAHALSPLELAVEMPIAVAVGLLGRTPRAVAVSGLAVVLASTGWIVPAISQYGIDSDFGHLLPGLALALLGTAALAAAFAAARPEPQPTDGPAASESSTH